MSRLRVIAVLLSTLFLMTRCGNETTDLPPQLENMLGTWRLVAPDSTQNVTLTFALDAAHPPRDITPYKTSGKAAVNDYTARMYASIDGKISADEVGVTNVGGSAAQLQFERDYFTRLRNVVRFEQPTPSRLRLYHGGTPAGVLEYRK